MSRLMTLLFAFVSFLIPINLHAGEDIAGTRYLGVAAILDAELEWGDSDIGTDEFGSGWILSYGYNFSETSSLEFSYGRVIDFTDDLFEFGVELEVFEVSALFHARGQGSSPFTRVGYSDGDYSLSNGGRTASSSESDILLGVGIDFKIAESGTLRLEYNSTDYNDEKVTRLQIGTLVQF